jgi:hypothetical protein
MTCPFEPDVFMDEVTLHGPDTSVTLAGETPAYIDGMHWRVYTEDRASAVTFEYPHVEGETSDVTYRGRAERVTFLAPPDEAAIIYVAPPDETIHNCDQLTKTTAQT